MRLRPRGTQGLGLPKQRLHFRPYQGTPETNRWLAFRCAAKEHLIWVDAGDFLFFADPALLLREHLKKLKGQVVATYPEVGWEVWKGFCVVPSGYHRCPSQWFPLQRPHQKKQSELACYHLWLGESHRRMVNKKDHQKNMLCSGHCSLWILNVPRIVNIGQMWVNCKGSHWKSGVLETLWFLMLGLLATCSKLQLNENHWGSEIYAIFQWHLTFSRHKQKLGRPCYTGSIVQRTYN